MLKCARREAQQSDDSDDSSIHSQRASAKRLSQSKTKTSVRVARPAVATMRGKLQRKKKNLKQSVQEKKISEAKLRSNKALDHLGSKYISSSCYESDDPELIPAQELEIPNALDLVLTCDETAISASALSIKRKETLQPGHVISWDNPRFVAGTSRRVCAACTGGHEQTPPR